MLVIFTAGCDTAVDLSDDPAGVQPSPEVGPQAASVDLSAMTSVAPDGRTYGCALSSYTGSDYEQAYQYRYAQLAFPESAIGRPAEVQRLTYRLRNENDRVLRQATCLIPKTDEARDLVLDWVSLDPDDGGYISGNEDDPSPILHEGLDCTSSGPGSDDVAWAEECEDFVVTDDPIAIDDGGGGGGDWGDGVWGDDIFDDWYPDAPFPDEGPGGSDADDCAKGPGDTSPPTGGDDPCGADCYDPPTDDETDDDSTGDDDSESGGGDGPHDAPGFLTGVTWQVVTSSGLVAAPYDLVQHALMNAECDPEPPCESDNPPEWCDEAGSCFDAEIENEDHRALLEAAERQELLSTLAEDSNWDSSWQGAREERVGVIRPLGDGYNAYPLPDTAYAREPTPVRVWIYSGFIPDDAVAHIHTHPFEIGEFIEWGNMNRHYEGRESEEDTDALDDEGIETGIIIDRSGILFYNADSPHST